MFVYLILILIDTLKLYILIENKNNHLHLTELKNVIDMPSLERGELNLLRNTYKIVLKYRYIFVLMSYLKITLIDKLFRS